jgi:CDP-glucose 4,6-dehydratase
VVSINSLAGFYKGKRVFLTGHTGFKGSWLLLWLRQLGAEVKGYALKPEQDNALYNLIGGNALCSSVIADIRDAEKLQAAIISFKPDYVFHLAAQPLVRLSYDKPAYTFETNVMGTANVLDAVRVLNYPCSVVIVTTDKVYENIEQAYRYKEEDKLGGYDPYSASKAACEIIVSSYRNSFFNTGDYGTHQKGIASARAGNVIGGGDRSKDRIIPDLISALEKSEPVVVRNPDAVRPWQHVLEPLSGYLLLGANLAGAPQQFSAAFNFGPDENDELTVREVVEKAIACWGSGSYTTPVLQNQPHEAGLLQLNSQKAKQLLHWQPKYSSAEAIEKTIDWYKNAKEDHQAFTLQQINSYQLL